MGSYEDLYNLVQEEAVAYIKAGYEEFRDFLDAVGVQYPQQTYQISFTLRGDVDDLIRGSIYYSDLETLVKEVLESSTLADNCSIEKVKTQEIE